MVDPIVAPVQAVGKHEPGIFPRIEPRIALEPHLFVVGQVPVPELPFPLLLVRGDELGRALIIGVGKVEPAERSRHELQPQRLSILPLPRRPERESRRQTHVRLAKLRLRLDPNPIPARERHALPQVIDWHIAYQR